MEVIETPIATIELEGKKFQVGINPKTFSTKSTGYYGRTTIEVSPEEKYSVQIQLVLVGSKPKKTT